MLQLANFFEDLLQLVYLQLDFIAHLIELLDLGFGLLGFGLGLLGLGLGVGVFGLKLGLGLLGLG